MKFRKIARIIDAVQFDGTPAGAVAVFEEFDIPGGKFVPGYDLRTGVLAIPTLEGDMRADRGDWIIKGVQGEFYPCKPSIFAETYEEESVAAEPQRWRDVKVELPEVSDEELILATLKGVRTGWFGMNKRWNLRGGSSQEFAFVTHYMPLPEPPKERP